MGWVPMAPNCKPVDGLIPQQAQIFICFAGAFLDKCLHTADAKYTAHARVHAGLYPFGVWVHAVTQVSTQLMLGALRVQWSMWDRIQDVREQELGTLWRSFIIQALFGFTLNTIPVLVSVLTFGVYVLLGNKLTAAEAFTSLSLFTVYPHVALALLHSSSQFI